MQKKIEELQTKISLLQDSEFINKLMLAYKYFTNQLPNNLKPKTPIKRGSAKDVITYIADDFTESLEEFKDYM